jgi:type IV pilus assembly protein PilZ
MPPDDVPAKPPGGSGPDNRQSYRAPIRLRVDYERMNTFFADYTKNISKGGTFIKTSRPLPIGTRFVFSMSVPALSEPVILTGEVTWVMTADAPLPPGEEPGMGIRFLFEKDSQRVQFEELVERMMVESLGRDMTDRLLHGK